MLCRYSVIVGALALSCGGEGTPKPETKQPPGSSDVGPLYGEEDLAPWFSRLAELKAGGQPVTHVELIAGEDKDQLVSRVLQQRLLARFGGEAADRVRWTFGDGYALQTKHGVTVNADLVVLKGPNLALLLAQQAGRDASFVAMFTAALIEHLSRPDGKTACLVIGGSGRQWASKDTIELRHAVMVSEGERQGARKSGCAYFDTFAVLGEDNFHEAVARPIAEGLDAGRLNAKERTLVGNALSDAIERAIDAHSKP